MLPNLFFTKYRLMRKCCSVLSLTIFGVVIMFSQQIEFRDLITDSLIPFVYITDKKGDLEEALPDGTLDVTVLERVKMGQSLSFYHIGYKHLMMQKRDLVKSRFVYLEPIVYNLPSIELRSVSDKLILKVVKYHIRNLYNRCRSVGKVCYDDVIREGANSSTVLSVAGRLFVPEIDNNLKAGIRQVWNPSVLVEHINCSHQGLKRFFQETRNKVVRHPWDFMFFVERLFLRSFDKCEVVEIVHHGDKVEMSLLFEQRDASYRFDLIVDPNTGLPLEMSMTPTPHLMSVAERIFDTPFYSSLRFSVDYKFFGGKIVAGKYIVDGDFDGVKRKQTLTIDEFGFSDDTQVSYNLYSSVLSCHSLSLDLDGTMQLTSTSDQECATKFQDHFKNYDFLCDSIENGTVLSIHHLVNSVPLKKY